MVDRHYIHIRSKALSTTTWMRLEQANPTRHIRRHRSRTLLETADALHGAASHARMPVYLRHCVLEYLEMDRSTRADTETYARWKKSKFERFGRARLSIF